ncbi:MAG TPA: M28 family peptidase [Solirubrobacteraceae bacterium]|nr:M28 family peptidase [Solirubrobacteraceae bacterium]
MSSDADLHGLSRETVDHLASFDRPSASDGERRAAEWIAGRLRAEGARNVRVEEERAHGTYWWPLGLLALTGGLASFSGRRWVRLAAGAVAAAGIADDVSGGRLWFRRTVLPRHPTWNVVAEAGDPDAGRTVVVVAHHDAAHWSLLFAPHVPEFFARHFPGLLAKSDTTPPVMFPVVGGPLLVALSGLFGSRRLRRLGGLLSFGTAATMVEIGSRSTVPGANDNLTGVATVLGLARTLAARPVEGLRVLLVSTGSEESFMEGMQAFAARHFPSLPVDRTHVICVDTVGSPTLMQLEGEGMLVIRDYPAAFKDLVAAAADDAGVELIRGIRFRNATDGLIAMKAGYPTVMLGSMNEFKAPSNYHWPTDTAANVIHETVVDCIRVCDGAIRRLAND